MTDYLYKCEKCGHTETNHTPLNYIIRLHDTFGGDKCNNAQMQRVRTAPAVRFLGGGWYVTDKGK